MVNPKDDFLFCIQQFLKSRIKATNVEFVKLSMSVMSLMNSTSDSLNNKKFSSAAIKNVMIINFNQIISSLDFLSDIVKEEHKIRLRLNECRKVALHRIKFCLDIIEEASSKNEITALESGQFLMWMDNALDHIAKIDSDKQFALTGFKETKLICEDILAHAMSIGQICLEEDSKVINGSCRTMLDALEELENELNKKEPNKAMVSLFAQETSNKLCALERKVDIAVLRLTLFVFSRYTVSLEKLHIFCITNSKKKIDQKELDDIILNFDLQVDRIFQIGLFAVSCSSNVRNGIDIQNCMANLEFLETELVPAMKMILKDDTLIHKTSALVYKNYWIREARKLKTLIYEIIDPSAFCKVIYDEISIEIDSILEENKEFKKSFFENILNFGRVLVDFTLTVVRIEAITDKEIKDTINKCNIITLEIGTAIEVLDDNNAKSYGRLLKRCKILRAEVKKLLSILKNGNNLCEENDISESNEKKLVSLDEKENTGQNMFLSEITSRGKEILENRSIMYKTPKKCYRGYTHCDKDGVNILKQQ